MPGSFGFGAVPIIGGGSGSMSNPPAPPPPPPPPDLTDPGPDTKSIPDGVLPEGQATFTDLTNWTLDAGWSHTGTAIQMAPGSPLSFATNIPSTTIPPGSAWVAFTQRGATASGIGVQLQGPFRNNPFTNRVTAQHVARFASAGHSRVRIVGNANYNGTVEDLQIVDMTALLAQPADIYIAAGQSLIAAETSSMPVDPDQDFWLPRCLYMPGTDNSTFGTKRGEVHACVAPLQMVGNSQGVSPATTFARVIEGATPAGRTVMILACASGGTRLTGQNAPWFADTSTTGSLFANMLSMATDALALNPGNVLRGVLWGQGESDRAPDIDQTYPVAFRSMLAELRGRLNLPQLPVILLGPDPDDTTTTHPKLIAGQERLDAASGDAMATPGVHYVPRPSGYLSSDGTHPVPEGQRIAGRLAAQRFILEGYLSG